MQPLRSVDAAEHGRQSRLRQLRRPPSWQEELLRRRGERKTKRASETSFIFLATSAAGANCGDTFSGQQNHRRHERGMNRMSPSAKSRVSATGLAKAANLRRLPQIGPAGVVRLSEAVRPWDRRVANSLVRLTAPTILYFTGGTASATSDQLNEFRAPRAPATTSPTPSTGWSSSIDGARRTGGASLRAQHKRCIRI